MKEIAWHVVWGVLFVCATHRYQQAAITSFVNSLFVPQECHVSVHRPWDDNTIVASSQEVEPLYFALAAALSVQYALDFCFLLMSITVDRSSRL